jgi:arabinogalactan endo-1,4-beta-galactosidase
MGRSRQQNKPAWAAQDFATSKLLFMTIFNVLNVLKAGGITPIGYRAMRPTMDAMAYRRASTNINFTALVNKGYDAVKAVDNSIKVIVHISNGHDNSLFRWIFDGLKNNGGKWDIIGMSLYPDPAGWAAMNTQCLSNMIDMVARYDKPVMICEVGMSWDQAPACQSFLADLMNKVRSVPGSRGLGVFYWEPQCYGNWQSYTKGAFDNSGKPTSALNAFN